MSTLLHLQDPSRPGVSLLDVLLSAAEGAALGGGVFAFASARGVDSLFDNPPMRRLTRRGSFDLVVGINAITDTRALAAMSAHATAPGLSARVLLHGLPNLFHPKFAWFMAGDELTLIVGSGNLTVGGLLRNFEAFTVTTISGPPATAAVVRIQEWLTDWDAGLHPPSAAAVQEAAKANSGSELSFRRAAPPEVDPITEPQDVDDSAEVLVAEVPKNAPSRVQLDVGKTQFESYFGGLTDQTRKYVLVEHVTAAGALEDLDPPRKLVFSSRSRNYRIELGAGHGKAYPDAGRPIAIFLRMPDGGFLYRLTWPDTLGHAEADAFLTSLAGPFTRNMRRETTTLAALKAGWPDCPLVKAV